MTCVHSQSGNGAPRSHEVRFSTEFPPLVHPKPSLSLTLTLALTYRGSDSVSPHGDRRTTLQHLLPRGPAHCLKGLKPENRTARVLAVRAGTLRGRSGALAAPSTQGHQRAGQRRLS